MDISFESDRAIGGPPLRRTPIRALGSRHHSEFALSSFHGGHSVHGDGEGSIADIALAASRRGFRAFGFTEHFHAPPRELLTPDPEDELAGTGDRMPGYAEDVLGVRAELRGEIDILLGTEVEYVQGAEDWTRKELSRWPFHYAVGSVHYLRIEGHDLLIDASLERFREAVSLAGSVDDLQYLYYEHVLGLLSWNLVRIVGHLDLVKIFLDPTGNQPGPRLQMKIADVLDAAKDLEVALDVNAAGLLKPCGEIYPAPWILEQARLGRKQTFDGSMLRNEEGRRMNDYAYRYGDDSHSPAGVGLNLDLAIDTIAAAGYDSIWRVLDSGELLREVD